MNLNAVPTKGNLIAAKNSLKLARQGFDLMDKKRNILIREIMELNEEAKAIQSEIDQTFTQAYRALEEANIQMGISNVEDYAFTIPLEDSIKIKVRAIMGTEIPLVEHECREETPDYSFADTKESLDEARACFKKVKDLVIRLSSVETSAYRLAINIKKTQKRANALKNITIPNYASLSKSIADALEEKDREEFTRLKVIKERLSH